MQSSKRRRLLALGLTVPALLAGVVVTTGSSNAASSGLSASAAPAAAAFAKAAKNPCPRYRFIDRTNIYGSKGKLIGHTSLYRYNRPVEGAKFCVVTWRNGVARGNRDITRGNLKADNVNSKTLFKTGKSEVRSPALRVHAFYHFRWWGGLRYEGDWFIAKRKLYTW